MLNSCYCCFYECFLCFFAVSVCCYCVVLLLLSLLLLLLSMLLLLLLMLLLLLPFVAIPADVVTESNSVDGKASYPAISLHFLKSSITILLLRLYTFTG